MPDRLVGIADRPVVDRPGRRERLRLAHVVEDEHQLAAGKRHRRHQLVAASRLVVILDRTDWRKRFAIARRRDDDARAVVAVGVGAEATLRPGDVDAAGAVGGHRRIGVGAEVETAGAEIELIDLLFDLLRVGAGTELVFFLAAVLEEAIEVALHVLRQLLELVGVARRVESAGANRQPGHHHRVEIGVVGQVRIEAAIGHEHRAGSRIDGDRGALVDAVLRVADANRGAPGDAAIRRSLSITWERSVEPSPSNSV